MTVYPNIKLDLNVKSITNSNCKVAILAGGMGSRLRDRSGDLPKPMVPLVGKPVIQHLIELCSKHGFIEIALLVHHQYQKIIDYLGNGERYGVNIKYVIEDSPRGTSGALHDALPMLADSFLVMYGDTFVDVNLKKFWNAHVESSADGTLFLHPNDHPHDSDLVEIDSDGMVTSIIAYPHPPGLEARNLVNGALYVLNRSGVENVTPKIGKADIAKDMFPQMINLGCRLKGYISPEYIKDMGTPERLDKVEHDFSEGLPERLSGRQLRSAVFLDRDGTLIEEKNHLRSADQLKLLPGAADAIRKLNRNGILAVVATNQPVVARGDITLNELNQIHARLDSELGKSGAFLDKLYFCPHHPEKGFQGEVVDLKVSCDCRKPKPGLIDQACRDLSIDRRSSWMIGDTTSDVESGRRAGVRTILLRTGYAGSDNKFNVKPDYVFPELGDAVDWVLGKHAELTRRMIPIVESASNGKRLILIGGLARSGKSFVAQVLKEFLHTLGFVSHVISLDGWLKPINERNEGIGVTNRYDMAKVSAIISSVVHSGAREIIIEPLYDRITKVAGQLNIEHSIGAKDIIIVEGVPALLLNDLMNLPVTDKVYVDIPPSVRTERLTKEYAWRCDNVVDSEDALDKREYDETPIVMQSRSRADFIVSNI